MYLIPLIVIAAFWFIIQSDRTISRIPTCKYQELEPMAKAAEAYTAGYWACAIGCVFIHPFGFLGSLGILVLAGIFKIRGALS